MNASPIRMARPDPSPTAPPGREGAPSDSTRFFETFCSDTRWLDFTPEERDRVDAFIAQWSIRPGDRVLEPGCGTGRLTALLAPLVGARGSVVAFDSAPALIDHAITRDLPSQVSFLAACAACIAIAPGTFDHVICFNVFPHLVPLRAITARLAGFLRPGGVFWIAHTCSRALLNGIHQSGPASIQDHLLPEPASLRFLLGDAGLTDIAITDAADHFLARGTRPLQPGANVRHESNA
jgi:SAM-dependent methyltransferase